MNDVALHDRFFKATLGRPDQLGAVLKAFLPPELAGPLDPASLVPLPTESVGEGLDSSLMDLAFSARFDGQDARIHLIVEHKSAPAPWVHVQLAHYLTGLWVRERKKGKPPSPLLPVVFYHGTRPWTLPQRLSEVLKPPAGLLSTTPDFSLPVIDAGRIDDDDIRRRLPDLQAILAMLSLKHIFEDAAVCLRLLLREIRDRNAPYGIIKPELDYVGGVHGLVRAQDMKRILDPIVKEEGMAQNIVDTWMEEWLQQGIQQGVQQGIRQEQDLVVRKLLERKMLPPDEIASLLEVAPEHVRQIAREIDPDS